MGIFDFFLTFVSQTMKKKSKKKRSLR